MNSKDLISKLEIVLKIVSKWETSKITDIERDIVLVKLQDTYEAVLCATTETNTHTEKEKVIETPISETIIAKEIIIEEQVVIEPIIVEIVVEQVIIEEPVVEKQEIPDEPTYIEPKRVAPTTGIRPMISRQVIQSLYGDDTSSIDSTENDSIETIETTTIEEPIIEEPTEVPQIITEIEITVIKEPSTVIEQIKTPIVEYKAPTTIGDTISTNEYTIADKIGETIKSNDIAHAVAKSSSVTLNGSIGVNDKFLMLNEIFEGDMTQYTTTIETLEKFTDLDEALIFIHDNYKWTPSNLGVQLLIELLGRKLS